ncbi:AI-2E family transporter [Halopseudomonas sp.]|jgi:predicted PurR-regulated permease PerM|uniref:AI-2E family transporter n=1 Tax=Halopseudomonas sp. TaxID=2901191 RepID=UPI00300218F3|nr:AI-2E family transporter [Halopseudomonas aestusnigri]|tara:strand:+ start:12862 stop:13953 length:1092 start_codon:yes stop_codon:yes gene_type:complete
MQAKLEQRSFLLMLVVVTLLFLYLLKPFFGAVFWACVIALLFHPLQLRLSKRWSGRDNMAALATLTVCMALCILPAVFVITSFVQEGHALYERVQTGKLDPAAIMEKLKTSFPLVESLFHRLNIDLEGVKALATKAAVTSSRFLAQNAFQLGQGTLSFFASLALMLYLAFFLLRDGPELVRMLVRALPLGDEREYQLFGKFAEVTRATVKGNLVVAAVQGALGGLIFWALGIPGALLWGVVMMMLSLIPVVGASLIWGPVAIYLLAIGHWTQGIILIAFGALVIGLVDNLLRPLLVGRDTKLPDYLVLLSTLGGFALFGINGFVIGPLIAALFIAFWQIFAEEFNPLADAPAQKPAPQADDPQ